MSFRAILVVDVGHCARCGKDHADLGFARFKRPCQKDTVNGFEWTHWAMCPETKEPILLRISIELP